MPLQDLHMLQSVRDETEGKLQMRLSPRKCSLDSLFKEVRVFKEIAVGVTVAAIQGYSAIPSAA